MIISEATIQQRPDSPLDVFHVALRGDQAEIGGTLAALADRYLADVGDVKRLRDDQATALDTLLATHCPALHRRASGIKLAAGRPEHAHPYSLSIVADPPSFGCSAALFNGPSGPAVVRNYDFTLRSLPELSGAPPAGVRPMMDPIYLMHIAPEDDGRETIGLVSMDLFAGTFDGINDAGLCACLLALSNGNAPVDTPRYDAFDELSIVRLLLESCDTVEAAVSMFERIPKQTVFIPCHYLVADRHGDGAVLEWDDAGSHIVRRTGAEPLVCTNHHLAGPAPADDPLSRAERDWSEHRHARLTERLGGPKHSDEEAWQAASAVRFAGFDTTGDIFGGTLWTALYDLAGGGAAFRFLNRIDGETRHYGPPYRARVR